MLVFFFSHLFLAAKHKFSFLSHLFLAARCKFFFVSPVLSAKHKFSFLSHLFLAARRKFSFCLTCFYLPGVNFLKFLSHLFLSHLYLATCFPVRSQNNCCRYVEKCICKEPRPLWPRGFDGSVPAPDTPWTPLGPSGIPLGTPWHPLGTPSLYLFIIQPPLCQTEDV